MSQEIEKAHRTGIGGSGAAAVWGCKSFKTIHDLYAECISLPRKENKNTLPMDIGNWCEPFIRQWYEAKIGVKGSTGIFVRHKTMDWMIGHLDWLSVKTENGSSTGTFAEFKVAGFHAKNEWGDPESCQVPLSYYLQGLHYSILTGIDTWDLVVMLGTDIKIYPCRYDAEIAENLIELEKIFWHERVLKRILPDADGSESCRRLLSQTYMRNSKPIDWAVDETAKLLNLLADVKINYKAEKENYEELCNKVRAAIGDREGLKTDKVVCTWKANKLGVRNLRVKLMDEDEDSE